ncbi:site-2 protease family protein [Aureliella helgolandensis]|nr:site-2 protease family protein [Aureliella helgolandensis]
MLVEGFNLFPSLDSLPLLLAESASIGATLGGLVTKFWLFFQVALGLGFVIFVHELGHFLAAKTFGVRCDKFYVGFDVPISIGPIKLPRTLGKFQWGETEYGIGIVPLGGYVKMLGQDDDPRKAAEENEKIRLGGDQEGTDEPELDPRSFPAKPVWQRMIIISAGVVMNLIFAVLLAGVAYRFGVPYTPTIVGSTYGGSPAWSTGLQTGDHIVRYGDRQEDDPQVRYSDFSMSVVMGGFQGKKEFPIAAERDGKRIEVVAIPTADYSLDHDVYRIGLNSPTTPVIGGTPYSPVSLLASVKPDLQAGDRIIAVNDETLPVDPRVDGILGSELTSRLQAHFETPVTVTVERPAEGTEGSPQTLQVELPAVPVKWLGLGFAPGPVVALQKGSIGEASGIKVGDVIEAVNDEPVVNALRLPAQIAALSGQEIRLKVRRGSAPNSIAEAITLDLKAAEAETDEDEAATPESDQSPAEDEQLASQESSAGEVLEITLAGPQQAEFDPIASLNGALTLGGLGIAFEVTSKISYVDPEISGEQVRVGDQLEQFLWVASDEDKEELDTMFSKQAFKKQAIEQGKFNVACLYDFLQGVPEGAKFKCYIRREGKILEPELKVASSQDWFWHQRGVGLSPLMDTITTDSFLSSIQLGLGETARRFTDVLDFLQLLVTGRIGAKGVGGPIAIVQAASSEASFGVSRLLLFLTLLSANLAILNFLPIPALDGGHMVFLLWEFITGKPVNEAVQIRLTMLGVLGLLSLMAFVVVNDILRNVS